MQGNAHQHDYASEAQYVRNPKYAEGFEHQSVDCYHFEVMLTSLQSLATVMYDRALLTFIVHGSVKSQ